MNVAVMFHLLGKVTSLLFSTSLEIIKVLPALIIKIKVVFQFVKLAFNTVLITPFLAVLPYFTAQNQQIIKNRIQNIDINHAKDHTNTINHDSFSVSDQNNTSFNPTLVHVLLYSTIRICLHDLLNLSHHYLNLSENLCTFLYFLMMTQLHRFASISTDLEFYLTEIAFLVFFVGSRFQMVQRLNRKVKVLGKDEKRKVRIVSKSEETPNDSGADNGFVMSVLSFVFPMLTSKILRKIVSGYFVFRGIQCGINSGSLRL